MDNVSYEDKLKIVAWVFENIVAHAKEGGSFRYLIYTRLGFGADAYVPLYTAGGMDISNEFDLGFKDSIIELVQKEKNASTEMKQLLSLCDEPGCYRHVSCGFPIEGGGYRHTCYEHSDFAKNDAVKNSS